MRDQKRKKKRTPCSFNPDAISADLHHVLNVDLQPLELDRKLLYSGQYFERDVYAYNQVNDFLKKFKKSTSNQSRLEEEAIANFHRSNLHMYHCNYHIDNISDTAVGDVNVRTLHRARLFINQLLGDLDVEEWFNECKHSSGTTLGLRYSRTNLEDKFKGPLTTTKRALPLFTLYRDYDPEFSRLIDEVNQNLVTSQYKVVNGSRLTTVDKDDRKRRTIAVEPTVNMFLQKGLESVLEKRLRPYLDISVQPHIHHQLAYESSITCSNATIDFSNASDCVSIGLVKYLLPRSWFEALSIIRSENIEIDGVFHPLYMISTMGNATTFPLETLIFYALALCCQIPQSYKSSFLTPVFLENSRKHTSVFGDDCILPSQYAETFMSLCESVGFIVNKEKSFFSNEPFRESCGMDFMSGRNIRIFYLKNPFNNRLSSLEPWLYIICNRLLKKYISYFGDCSYIYEKALWTLLLSYFRQYKITVKFVPDDYPDDAGLKVFSDLERWIRLLESENVSISRISTDIHGTVYFKFLRFHWRENQIRPYFPLRYWLWKKFPSHGMREVPHKYIVKKIGSYVVSKSSSCFISGMTFQTQVSNNI